jgi:hypothetical protein
MMPPHRLGKTAKTEIKLMDGLAQAISRDELEVVLEAQPKEADNHSRIELFMAMMHDPAHASKKLATMARECGLSYTQMADMIRKHRLSEGIIRMTEHVPQVMEDVARESLSSTAVCEKCEGEGSVLKPVQKKTTVNGETVTITEVAPQKCKHCDGEGTVYKAGSAAARKILFETMGLTGKAPMVNVNNNTLNVDAGGGMEDVLKLGRARQLERPTIDAEVIPDADTK